MDALDQNYWNQRYLDKRIGWDIGYVSDPIKEFFDNEENKNQKILVPGAGNGYEVEYIYNSGFQDVHLLDFAEQALLSFNDRFPNFPKSQLHLDDFFNHHSNYDLIIEQTFFCAILPELRKRYVDQMYRLLNKGGRLVGLLFNKEFDKEGPPYGGTRKNYLNLFETKFDLIQMEACNNSIPPRLGNELFFELKKNN